MKIPDPITPRPGEKVVTYAGSMKLEGIFIGYNSTDDLKIDIDGNQELFDDFLKVRPFDPFNRKKPNWDEYIQNGQIIKVPEEQGKILQKILKKGIGGITYMDLIQEIYLRGYEIYCVGGTIRDIIRGEESNDVDLVTTMPIKLLLPVLNAIFGEKNYSRSAEFGFINIASKGTIYDPKIDLKNFFLFAPGSKYASFGSNLTLDAKLRDFACNSIYYDPINNFFIDPTGHGISDAKEKKMRLVKDLSIPHPVFSSVSIPLRFFKFLLRGFTYEAETLVKIQTDYYPIFEKVGHIKRIKEFKRHILKKYPVDMHEKIIDQTKSIMDTCQCIDIWNSFYKEHIDALLGSAKSEKEITHE